MQKNRFVISSNFLMKTLVISQTWLLIITRTVLSYQYFTSTSSYDHIDWLDALGVCSSYGATLATINDGNDNFEIWAGLGVYSKSIAFIGLNSQAGNGNWGWQDGTPLNYTSWYDSDAESQTSKCVYLSATDGLWYTIGCTTTFYSYAVLFACNDAPTSNPTQLPSMKPTIIPTDEPTDKPTYMPTLIPTDVPSNDPTHIPSSIPTLPTNEPSDEPTNAPTMEPQCDNDININWDESIDIMKSNINIKWDSYNGGYIKFNLFFNDYIQDSTYVIDFAPFSGNIDEPTECENRNSTSYEGIDFNNYWDGSLRPWYDNNIGSVEYLAYPPSTDYWSVSSINSNDITNDCGNIIYNGTFSLSTMYDTCKNKTDFNSIKIYKNSTTNYIQIEGTLYVSVVAPIDINNKEDGYHVYELNRYPFLINIPIIYTSIIDEIFSEGFGDFDTTLVSISSDSSYHVSLTLYTYAGTTYFYLSYPKVISITDNGNDDISINDITFEYNFTDCIDSGDTKRCQQLWQANFASNLGCPMDYSGSYTFQWNVMLCEDTDDFDISNCELTETTLESNIYINYEIETCNYDIINLDMTFDSITTNNKNYSNSKTTGYDIGDRVYVSLSAVIDDGNDNYNDIDIVNVTIYNVWLCAVELGYTLNNWDESMQTGGCLDESIDNIVYGPYMIIDSGIIEYFEDNDYGTQYETTDSPNNVRYSFEVPYISNDDDFNLYIHTQVEVNLIYENRRRVLLSNDYYNYVHFKHNLLKISYNDENNDNNNNKSNDNNSVTHLYVIILGFGIFSIASIGIIGIFFYKYNKQKQINNKNIEAVHGQSQSQPQPIPSAPLPDVEMSETNRNNIRYSNAPTPCIVCHSERAKYTTVPCGHLVACTNCFQQRGQQNGLLNDFRNICPICRQNIQQLIKIH